MELKDLRYREKRVPPPKYGLVKVGEKRTRNKLTGAIAAKFDVKVSVLQNPMEIKRTWDEKHLGPPYRSGGPFSSLNILLPSFGMQGVGTYRTAESYPDPNYYYEYLGGFTNPGFWFDTLPLAKYLFTGGGTMPDSVLTGPDINSKCSEAYNKLRPHIEQAGLGVALAEARDIPRMLKTTSLGFHNIWRAMGGVSHGVANPLMRPKKLADQFLNQQFGWIPFIKDLRDFHRVYVNSQRYIDQVSRDNNTWTKRVRTIWHQETSTPITSGIVPDIEPWGVYYDSMCRNVSGPGGTGTSHWSAVEEIYTRLWAAGSFKYYRPEFDRSIPGYDSGWNRVQQLMILYGLRLNPSVVYKATPWSWLIDWFGNVGNTVQRATDMAYDSIVSRYMYLMQTHVRKVVLKQTLHFNSGDVTLTWSRDSEIKQRQEATNPYNFCLSAGLTARQISILAALGISRR
jgi:hypothetical protein